MKRVVCGMIAVCMGMFVIPVYADTVDTLCDGHMEGFVSCENGKTGKTEYLECFGGDILQPIGGSMRHTSLLSGGVVVDSCPVTEKIEAYTASTPEHVVEVSSSSMPLVAWIMMGLVGVLGVWSMKKRA